MARLTILLFSAILFSIVSAEVEIITKPKPGQEYVYVHPSGRSLKKDNKKYQKFETSHKRPSSLAVTVNEKDDELEKSIKKREANPADAPAPPPAGAIKLDPKKLLERYKSELKTSTTTTTPKSTTPTKRRRRIKRDPSPADATSPLPILTTATPARRVIDDDTIIETAGSDKKHSRIKIKEAPNGQEYEYEYVYYYYDDENDEKDGKDGKTTSSHDGSARNEINTNRGRHSEKPKPVPEANEVVPTRGRSRDRQIPAEDTIDEERLPVNTRFPPRSRNLNTTPLPEEETKPSRGRGRGRPTESSTEAEVQPEEVQASRSRTRSNIRRPSLVDSDSFNTHPSSGEPPSGGPSFPTSLPAGPVRFLGATPNERDDIEEKDIPSAPAEDVDEEEAPVAIDESVAEKSDVTEGSDIETTTVMSGMKKAVLDLYALSQGTQKMLGEEQELTEDDAVTTEESEVTTQELTTEELTTEATTTTTSTTTTTTTTPEPTTTTTTTTTAAPETGFGRNKFNKGRNKKTTTAAPTSETTASESKPKKFGRPSFGRPRLGGRTTAHPVTEKEVNKEESKPVSQSKPVGGRRFSSRTRGRTTAAPSEEAEETSASTAAPVSRPSLRQRPGLSLRGSRRTTTVATTAAEEESHNEETSAAAATTTARPRPRIGGAGIRPLRPGPRIGSLARTRPGAPTTTTTTEAPAEDAETGDEEPKEDEEAEEKEPEPASTPDPNPLNRLRNRQRLTISARPKAAASAPVQVRRINPLLARRKTTAAPESVSSEAPEEAPATEAEAEDEETDAPAPSSTTEEPKGLNKLLRRRIGARPPLGSHQQ